MRPKGFEDWDHDEATNQFFRQLGRLGIYIVRLGSSWGYLIFRRGQGVPIMAEFSFDWDLFAAHDQAMRAMEAGVELRA